MSVSLGHLKVQIPESESSLNRLNNNNVSGRVISEKCDQGEIKKIAKLSDTRAKYIQTRL